MAKAGKTPKLLKPMMLTIAAAAAWAAMNEPVSLTLASAGVWGLEILAVALLIRAVLAMLTPVVALGIVLLGAAMRQAGNGRGAEP
jgi:hypothetical protein